MVVTKKFLDLCEQYGSERLAIRIVAAGRSAGVPELPEDDDWTAWNAEEMRAAVEHLLRKRGARRSAAGGSGPEGRATPKSRQA